MVTLSPRARAHATRAGRRCALYSEDMTKIQGWLAREALEAYLGIPQRLAWMVAGEAAARTAIAVRQAREAAEDAVLSPEVRLMEESWSRWCAMGEDDGDDADT